MIIRISKNSRLILKELLEYSFEPKNTQILLEEYSSSEISPIDLENQEEKDDESSLSPPLHRATTLLLAYAIIISLKKPQVAHKILFLDFMLPLEVSKWSEKLPEDVKDWDLKRFLCLARGILYTSYTSQCLLNPSFAIACLSLERWGLKISSFADYESMHPPQPRDVIVWYRILRAMLEQSRFTSNDSEKDIEKLEVKECCYFLVEYYGSARRILRQATKVLEQEINTWFFRLDSMDFSNIEFVFKDVYNAVKLLSDKAYKRLAKSENPAKDDERNDNLALKLQKQVLQFQYVLQMEFETTSEILLAFEKEQVSKSENKTVTKFIKEDNFDNMTEAQIEKVMKKRALKQKKAAAKQSSKQKSFGLGTGISNLLHFENLTKETCLTHSMLQTIETSFFPALLSGGVQRKPKLPKGTRDYFPEEMSLRQYAIGSIRHIFLSHGGKEIDTPIFELHDTLMGKYGDEGSQLIYDLADQGGEALSLRYDLTVPFARFLAMYGVGNMKRFHIGKVYRRDQPVLSRGRYREFYQCDFDIAIQQFAPMVPDSECICIMIEILSALDIGNFQIKVNHRMLLDAVLDLSDVPSDKFKAICSSIDKLDKETWENVSHEMIHTKGLSQKQVDSIGTFVLCPCEADAMKMYAKITDPNKPLFDPKHSKASSALKDMQLLFEYLDAMDKLSYVKFDLSLARGLDYYTGVIYEAVSISEESGLQVGSIGGGGRYDTLVSMFQEANKVTPCVGVSIGIERVFTLMEERIKKQVHSSNIHNRSIDVYIASAGSSNSFLLKAKMRIAKLLWDARIRCEYNPNLSPKLKYELQHSLEENIPFLVIVGEDEYKEGKCKIKDLQNRTEEEYLVKDLVKVLKQTYKVLPVGCEFTAEEYDS